MDIINSYLETMFINLPNTADVIRAKRELGQMMEDKYTELVESGVSENEAVGTVISEFGNLDELALDLGIDKVVENAEPVDRMLSLDEAKRYLNDCAGYALKLSIGVMSCILSICPAILGEQFGTEFTEDVLGPVGLFIVAGIGVSIIVFASLSMKDWSFIKTEKLNTDFATTKNIETERNSFKGIYALLMTLGILLCILSVIPPIIFDVILNGALENIGSIFMFIFVAIGVFMIVYSNIRMGSYNKLLKLNDKSNVGGHYVKTQEAEVEYSNKTVNGVMSVFWPTVTCLYLTISFLTFAWSITWIIWPIAAIVNMFINNTYGKNK